MAIIVVPQAVLLGLCFAQRDRILKLEQRLREAGVPVTFHPGEQHDPVNSRGSGRQPP
jgi:hypothetical protein